MSNTNEMQKGITKFNFSSQSGGRDVITRILDAYGFKSRQSLCNHLGVSQSTMANRWMRDTFPHDWVIACHLDTGTSVLWLSTGHGDASKVDTSSQETHLEIKNITDGVLTSGGYISYDPTLLPKHTSSLFAVTFERQMFILEKYSGEINDGMWLIKIDGLASVRQLYRFPKGRVRIENGKASFECDVSEIQILGKVLSQTTYME